MPSSAYKLLSLSCPLPVHTSCLSVPIFPRSQTSGFIGAFPPFQLNPRTNLKLGETPSTKIMIFEQQNSGFSAPPQDPPNPGLPAASLPSNHSPCFSVITYQ